MCRKQKYVSDTINGNEISLFALQRYREKEGMKVVLSVWDSLLVIWCKCFGVTDCCAMFSSSNCHHYFIITIIITIIIITTTTIT